MRPGSTRPLNLTKVCGCGATFQCADPKRLRCPKCSVCPHCSKPIRIGNATCIKCKRFNKTKSQKLQWDRLHELTKLNNPSKRPEVRKKLSKSKMGDLNPARTHREQFAIHIAKYRPQKISKLEDSIAVHLSTFKRQYKVGWYSLDFADPLRKLAVEVQGCWHHSCPLCFPGSPTHPTQKAIRGNDKRRTTYLINHGWKIINLWEHDIRNNNVQYSSL